MHDVIGVGIAQMGVYVVALAVVVPLAITQAIALHRQDNLSDGEQL
jgi:hypothetical protein